MLFCAAFYLWKCQQFSNKWFETFLHNAAISIALPNFFCLITPPVVVFGGLWGVMRENGAPLRITLDDFSFFRT
ncbi:hypothetical protein HanRHA438_Chr05g0211841 [Helianthus annuus]|uniref:Uncharacterized protein n=1 Tax=Helianthus annuus TaxID=4232 RepID=A0A251UP24_HELAN|nr:hypothetical protein HanXRQr2_Chr05g0201971 [Helianthus annuus]KAJ0917940.1 hypothetical protein HanRHA438_Chr05g0211841 [Helianthus annuus]